MEGAILTFFGTIIAAVIGGYVSMRITKYSVQESHEKQLEVQASGFLAELSLSCEKIARMCKMINDAANEQYIGDEEKWKRCEKIILRKEFRVIFIQKQWEKSSGYVYLLLKADDSEHETFDAIQTLVNVVNYVSYVQKNIEEGKQENKKGKHKQENKKGKQENEEINWKWINEGYLNLKNTIAQITNVKLKETYFASFLAEENADE